MHNQVKMTYHKVIPPPIHIKTSYLRIASLSAKTASVWANKKSSTNKASRSTKSFNFSNNTFRNNSWSNNYYNNSFSSSKCFKCNSMAVAASQLGLQASWARQLPSPTVVSAVTRVSPWWCSNKWQPFRKNEGNNTNSNKWTRAKSRTNSCKW